MANPARRRHTGSSGIATVLLVVCAAMVGSWLASAYDVLRVGVLDKALANRLGYIGEITDATIDPRPHGITRAAQTVSFLVAMVGGFITYAATTVARRLLDDPEAIAYALGATFLGAAAGFVWLSTDWPTVQPEPGGAFAVFIGAGNIWVPLLIGVIALLCILVWWVNAETGQEGSGAPPEVDQTGLPRP